MNTPICLFSSLNAGDQFAFDNQPNGRRAEKVVYGDGRAFYRSIGVYPQSFPVVGRDFPVFDVKTEEERDTSYIARLAIEKAERDGEDAVYRAHLAEVVALLPPSFTLAPHDPENTSWQGGTFWIHCADTPDKSIRVSIRGYRTKDGAAQFNGAGGREISISRDKPPQQVAKDLLKRLIPHHLEVAKAQADAKTAQQTRDAGIAATRARFGISAHGGYVQTETASYVSITVDSPGVCDVTLRNVSEETALKVLALLGAKL